MVWKILHQLLYCTAAIFFGTTKTDLTAKSKMIRLEAATLSITTIRNISLGINTYLSFLYVFKISDYDNHCNPQDRNFLKILPALLVTEAGYVKSEGIFHRLLVLI